LVIVMVYFLICGPHSGVEMYFRKPVCAFMHALPRFIHEGSKPATRAGALTQGLECHFFFMLTKRSLPVLESYWAEIFLDTGFYPTD
jgi:hypothetical protein